MQEAIVKVRAELGRDAVILHSKKFRRGGAFGLFGRPRYEVIAAIDLPGEAEAGRKESEQQVATAVQAGLAVGQSVVGPVIPVSPPPSTATSAVGRERRSSPAEPVSRPAVQVGKVTVSVAPPDQTAAPVDPMPAAATAVSSDSLVVELAGLRRMIHELSSQLASKGSGSEVARGWKAVKDHLLRQELLPEYVTEIEEEVFRTCNLDELQDQERVAEVARRYFIENFTIERRKADQETGRRVVALVGPTGVGKTTTVAKLAAQYALFAKRAVGLLTVDTYRIAAVDQLKTYAEIINLPVEVAFSPEEAREALARLGDREIVLMDTAGRSQKNDLQMAEVKAYLEAVQPDEVHLVLSTTTKQRDLEDCLNQFRETGYRQLIFTKLDETDSYGAIFNCSRRARCPITYLTFGQNVPDDIEEASQERLADLLLREVEWRR